MTHTDPWGLAHPTARLGFHHCIKQGNKSRHCARSPDQSALRRIAESQGRQFQAVLDDALRDYIERQHKGRPRRHLVAAIAASVEEFDSLYRELAK